MYVVKSTFKVFIKNQLLDRKLLISLINHDHDHTATCDLLPIFVLYTTAIIIERNSPHFTCSPQDNTENVNDRVKSLKKINRIMILYSQTKYLTLKNKE